jgi:hypothetical protein
VSKIVYDIVQHDGGWAYRVGKVLSEPFATRELAHQAAQRAADRQRGGVDAHDIEYEDSNYHWHQELARGGAGPDTEVDDPPSGKK